MKNIIYILLLLSFSTSAQKSPNLVSFWRFENNANDASGSGYNCTTTSAPTYSVCKFGNGTTYNGTSNFLKATSLNLSATDKISICFWIKYTGTGTQVVIEHSVSWNTNNAFLFNIQAGNLGYYNKDGGVNENAVGTSKLYNDGNWHYVVITCDRNQSALLEGHIYVDGKEDTVVDATYRDNTSGNFSTFDLYMGSRASTSFFFAGSLDEIKIFNRVLSENEIRKLMLGFSPEEW